MRLKASEIIEDVTIRARSEGVDATAAAAERLARAGDAVVASSDRQSRSTLSVERALDRLQRQIDSAYRESQLFEQGQRTLDRALQQGRLSAEGYERSLGLLQTKYGSSAVAINDNTATLSRFEKQTGLASHQVTNLGYQLNDVAVSLAGGQSPFTVLVQQGSQILPILSAAPGGVGGALLGIGRYLVGLVNPATAAAAALAAVGALAYLGLSRASAEAELLEKSLTGLGRSTASTAAGLARISEAAASQGKLTVAAAKETAAALASTGQIGISNFEGLIGISKQFAAALGLDAAEANAKLASSFADPLKGADELNGKLNFLSDATRAYIRELAAQNDQTGAQRALLDALGPAIANSTANTTLLGRAWAYVANAAASAGAAIAAALKGPSPEQALQGARARLEDISTGLFARTATGQAKVEEERNRLMVLEEQYRRNGAAAAAAAKAMADEAAANKISVQAGDITRALNPLAAKYDELRSKAATLKTALETPSKLSDVKATQEAYDAYSRAVATLTDGQGKLISSTDLLRQKDELAIAAKKASTDAEKAAVAERQKALDLVGEVITKEEAARRVAHAGALERIKDAKDSGSSAKDAADAYDNALQRSKDTVEELRQQQEQASKTTAEVYKLTEANKLRRAAASAGRSDEAGITEAINAQAEAYARQRVATEQAIEAQKRYQESVRETAESVSSFVKDLVGGKGLDSALKSLGQTSLTNSLDALLTGKGPLAASLGLAPTEKGGVGGILGLDYAKLTKAVTEGTTQGTFSGFTNLFGTPQQGPTQNGTTLDVANRGTAIQGVAGVGAAALGAYGAGASTGSSLAGGLTGAISGAAAGAAFGPAGIAIGAILGAGAGLLGASSAKAKAKAQREAEAQANYKQAQPQIASFRSQARGEPQGTLQQTIAESNASARQLYDVAFLAKRFDEAKAIYDDFLTYEKRTLDTFSNSWFGLLDSLNSGLGPDSPFSQARGQVESLGQSLKGFVANTEFAFAGDTAKADAARSAARSYALQVLDGAKTLSTVATRMQEISGAATGLQQVLTDLGLGADDAAAAISAGVTGALARLKASFEADLGARTNDARGAGYLNDVSGLLAEVATLRADAASLGTDQGLVTNYFSAKAQEIVNGANLTGAAFDGLIARFPDLAGVVREAGVTIDETARAIEAASRKLGYQDRIFAALNDNSSLAGQLAAFDRSAQREREAEIRAGGDAINELEGALAAERLKIITSFADNAVAEQKRALEEAQNFFDAFSRNLRQFVDGLRSGSDSPLSPQARLAAAQSQYDAQLALAQGGNRDAINGLTTYASALIDAGKAFYASSAGYQTIFETVTAQLLALPTQVSAEQFIVDAIKAASTDTIAAIDTNGDGFISLQEATNAGLGSIFRELDTNGDGQISALELIRGATQSTAGSTDYQNTILAQTQQIVGASQNLLSASNSLQASSNAILGTQASLLDQIRSLNGTSAATLAALQGQFGTNNTVTFQGVSLTNNMVEALNKIVFNTANTVIGQKQGAAYTYAEGGWVSGPGTGTSDSIAARLSNGEFVVNARAANENRALLESINGGGMAFDGLVTPVAIPAAVGVPVPVQSGGGSSEVKALREELRAMARELAAIKRAVVTGAVHVREGIDQGVAAQRGIERETKFGKRKKVA